MTEKMSIIKVQFELESLVPLKMDRFHGLPEPKSSDGYLKQAEEHCYRDEDGYLAIPSDAIKACMKNASSELGKKMDGKRNRQTIMAGVMFDKLFHSIGRKNHDGINSKPVTRGKGDKVTRVPSYRPIINKWAISGTMILMGVPEAFARECLELGGVRYGLLSHRPEFGRYLVKKFEVIKS